jgi:RNA polymerase sigma-70 factor, ECF subfamily
VLDTHADALRVEGPEVCRVSDLEALSDSCLAQRVLQDDRLAWEVLYHRHAPGLQLSIARHCGESAAIDDIVQETFLEAWSSMARFDTDRDFAAWICGIGRHRALAYRRQQWRAPTQTMEYLEQLLDTTQAVDEAEAIHQGLRKQHALQGCLEEIGPEQRQWLYWRYVEHQPIESIAEVLHKNYQATAKILHRLRDILRRCCEKRLRGENL